MKAYICKNLFLSYFFENRNAIMDVRYRKDEFLIQILVKMWTTDPRPALGYDTNLSDEPKY